MVIATTLYRVKKGNNLLIVALLTLRPAEAVTDPTSLMAFACLCKGIYESHIPYKEFAILPWDHCAAIRSLSILPICTSSWRLQPKWKFGCCQDLVNDVIKWRVTDVPTFTSSTTETMHGLHGHLLQHHNDGIHVVCTERTQAIVVYTATQIV